MQGLKRFFSQLGVRPSAPFGLLVERPDQPALPKEEHMTVRRRLVALSIGAVFMTAPMTALAADSGSNVNADALNALGTRSQGLNARYGNAVTRLTAKQFSELWNAGGSKMSPDALNALVTRSQGLNARYGNAVTRLTAKQFSELWKAGGSKMSSDALNALVTRSQGLNARYGNAVTRVSVKQAAAPPITSSTSFSWGDFGIGASAAVGLVLLLSGIAVTTRSRRRTRVVSRIG
jgi:hypothetical protein